LGRVFFPDASRRRPPCVVQPRSAADVQTTIRTAAATGAQVTVRGGGLSSNCVADGAVMIDLSTHLGTAFRGDDRVIVSGGATVGAMLESLQSAGRVVPVGIVGLAGFGLAARGGVGYLTRSVGLTLDHLIEVELVLPSGDIVRLSDASTGDEADLWWAVRGCAPCFGVVTSAVLRTHEQGPVFIDRLVVGLDALAEYFRVAPELPRDTTMGAVLGYVPGSTEEPVLFLYTACSSQDSSAIDKARSAATAVAAAASSAPRYRAEMRGRYLSELPEFSIPGPEGEEPQPIRLPAPGDARGWFYGKSVFTGPTLGADVAEALVNRIRQAPTPACRIDFQHTGGALGDVDDSSTAFWGRGGEWNIPLNAIWSDPEDSDACYGWARETVTALAGDTIGVYSVEVRPGFPETEREVEMAFGANLARLRSLRQRFDPTGVLGSYPL
jgi:FAD/FMN-containing dehydrogenase